MTQDNNNHSASADDPGRNPHWSDEIFAQLRAKLVSRIAKETGLFQSHASVEDLVHEAYQSWRRSNLQRDTFPAGPRECASAVFGWLVTSARFHRNNARRLFLRMTKTRLRPPSVQEFRKELQTASRIEMERESRERVNSVVDSLGNPDAWLVSRRAIMGLSYKAIAEEIAHGATDLQDMFADCETTPSALCHRYRRALKRLRPLLPPDLFDPFFG